MESVPVLQSLVDSLSDNIDDLEEILSPFLEKDLNQLAGKCSNPGEEADLYVNLAYMLDALLFAYLKSTGVNTNKHDIMKELERVKSYMSKVKEETNRSERKQRKLVLDKEAAKRFIKSALESNNEDNEKEKEKEKDEVVFTGKHTRLDEEEDISTDISTSTTTTTTPVKKRNKKAVKAEKKRKEKKAKTTTE